MGKRGPAKKPTKLKLVEGNPGKKRLSKSEPDPPPGVPPCPTELDALARREWKRIGKLLFAQGLLTHLDLAALAGYCVAFSRFLRFEAKLKKDGPDAELQKLGTEEKPYFQQSPTLTVSRGAAKDMSHFLAKFGLSPSDRAGLVTLGDPVESFDDRIKSYRKK